jgi:hypothetical protein
MLRLPKLSNSGLVLRSNKGLSRKYRNGSAQAPNRLAQFARPESSVFQFGVSSSFCLTTHMKPSYMEPPASHPSKTSISTQGRSDPMCHHGNATRTPD